MRPEITYHDPAKMPDVGVSYKPEDHMLEAWCPSCHAAVDAECPRCGGNVEPPSNNTPEARSVLPQVELYRRLLTLISGARNAKFMICCIFIATGDGYAEGKSMNDLAKTFGVCRATVSKQCRFICSYLGIAPSPYMRKEAASVQCRISNRRPRKL